MAYLKDSQKDMERNFDSIRRNLQKFDNLDPSEQEKVSRQIFTDLKGCDTIIESMKNNLGEAPSESIQKLYSDSIATYKKEIKSLREQFTNKQNQRKNIDNLLNTDDINVRMKNNNELTVGEAIAKGKDLLNQDGQAIHRMIAKTNETKQVGNAVLADIAAQKEKMKGVNSDLKEIDYSLNRAGKQLATMFKMYATDKLILCMIVLILLIIVAIIIVAAVGGDKAGSFNVPHDIFTNSATNTTKTRILFLE